MANSLRAKISKLRHDRSITEEEYQELISKLDGHDKQIKSDAIEPIMRGIDDFRTLERKMCKYFNEVDMNKEKDDLERLALDIVCHGMQTIGCLIQELDLINYQAKEQKDE